MQTYLWQQHRKFMKNHEWIWWNEHRNYEKLKSFSLQNGAIDKMASTNENARFRDVTVGNMKNENNQISYYFGLTFEKCKTITKNIHSNKRLEMWKKNLTRKKINSSVNKSTKVTVK